MARKVLPSRVFRRAAALAAACLGLVSAASLRADEVVKMLAGNISSGDFQSYDDGPGNRIFQGLKPDIAMIQELNVGNNTTSEYRAWVSANFGSTFSYFVESGKNIPNGIVSRYPILSSGVWDDTQLTDREFVWAKIDIPGDINLYAISVHLKASSGDASTRNTQATNLRNYIQANVTNGEYVVIGGDFNTENRTESCISTLSTLFKTTSPWPADQAGNTNTNAAQAKPYDWVLPSTSLATLATPLVIGTNTHTNGLVFDSRDYSPLSLVSPVQTGDSGVSGMQHMAVMRAFLVPVNDPPVIAQGDSVSVTLSKNNTPTAFSRSLNATDPEGNTLTWSIQTQAAHGTAGIVAPVTGGTVSLSYTPVTNYVGSDSFVVRVSDGLGGTDSITVNLTIQEPPNTAPVITEGTAVSVTLSKNNTPTAFSRSLNATDANGDSLAWTITTQAAHGTAGVVAPASGGTVALSYTPVTNYTGSDSFVVQVSDGKGGTDTITVNLTIQEPPNTAPVITEGTSVSVTLSRNNTPTAFSRSLSATDANGDSLAWTIFTQATHGTAGIVAHASGGTVALSYTPVTNYTGSDFFVVQVSDGKGGTDTILVNLTINPPPNTAPVIAQGTSVPVTLSENGTPVAFSLGLSATDGEGDTLAWSIATPAQHGTAGIVAPASGGSIALSYSPAADYSGPDSFVVQVSDGHGGTDIITVNLTIEPAPNKPPVIAGADTRSLAISQNGYPAPFQLTLQAQDADEDPLAWSVSNPAGHGTASVESASGGASAAVFYQPATGFTGADSFTIQVSDGQGGSDTVLVQVTVESSTAFDAWTYAAFAPLTPETEATVWGENADPDGDGLSNLKEFANGLNPQLSDGAPNLIQLAFATEGGQRQSTLTLKLRTENGTPALHYTLQTTADPAGGWHDVLPEDYTLVGEVDLGGGFIARTIRINMDNDEAFRAFRLVYTAPE